MTREQLLLFGARLRDRRTELGMTQEMTAERVGISLRFYQMLERGEKCVSLDTLIELGRTLNISLDHLLLGQTANQYEPLSAIFSGLTPSQRSDALQILRLYARACRSEE